MHVYVQNWRETCKKIQPMKYHCISHSTNHMRAFTVKRLAETGLNKQEKLRLFSQMDGRPFFINFRATAGRVLRTVVLPRPSISRASLLIRHFVRQSDFVYTNRVTSTGPAVSQLRDCDILRDWLVEVSAAGRGAVSEATMAERMVISMPIPRLHHREQPPTRLGGTQCAVVLELSGPLPHLDPHHPRPRPPLYTNVNIYLAAFTSTFLCSPRPERPPRPRPPAAATIGAASIGM